MSCVSLFEIISTAFFEPKIFWCIPPSPADAVAVNTKGIKTLLAYGLIIFFINGNAVFSNRPSNLLRNPFDWIIFGICVFHNLISIDELFAKDLRRFEICLSVNNNSWAKLVSLLLTMFDDNLNTTSVSFFTADFNLSSCEFDSFTFKLF